MLRLDDRTGDVLTTIGLFAAVAGAAYAARTTIAVFVLGLLLAYLLEPAVGWTERRLPSQPYSRTAAVSIVFLIGAALLAGLGYAIAPAVTGQIHKLKVAMPDMRARLVDSQFFARQSTPLAGVAERAARAAGAAAEDGAWLLMVPVIAVFFLNGRDSLIDAAVDLFSRRRDRASVKQTIAQIDTMLAQYTRAQLATAALSAVFYSGSMIVLKYPYPLVLGILGGALEFLPTVGWILASAAILTSGWLVHAPWIWMAGLMIGWRILLNFVISPRIFGDRLQMDPMTVFFALLAGGQIAGLLGVILSIPVVAVLRILWLQRSARQNAAAA